MKNPLQNKLYYSISEVAGITDLQAYTLRAWEKEFSCLRPKRMRGKNRAYKERDIGIILLIKFLLYSHRYTTEGVKQKLRKEPKLLQRLGENSSEVRRIIQGDGEAIDLIASLADSEESKQNNRPIKSGAGTSQTNRVPEKTAPQSRLDMIRQELRQIISIME